MNRLLQWLFGRLPIGWLQLAIDELEAGRTAQAREGQVFGLPLGQRL